MKKNILTISAIVATFIFSNCENKNTINKDEQTHEHAHSEDSHSKNENACKMPLTPEDSAKYHVKVLEVKGEVKTPLSLSVDSLRKMTVIALDSFNVVCQTGATTTQNISFRGVLLKEILEKAEIIQHSHKDRNFYIVAKASDGYMATFSWAEIFNNETGENTYVTFEENGKSIVKGDFVLNCTNDIKTGPRHVYWLESIEVHRVK